MTELHERISALVGASTRDLDEIERTLTDGYAQALSLEAERWRLERRMTGLTRAIGNGDLDGNARAIADVANRLEDSGNELATLRGMLAELRRHAAGIRGASATPA